MNKSKSHLHDLNNKLLILYGLLNMSQKGSFVDGDRVDAVKSRINEIVKSLHKELKLEGPDNIQLTLLNRNDFCNFISHTVSKLRRIYCDLSINFTSSSEIWAGNHMISIEKELLYQAIENAVENACNAKAIAIEFNLNEKQEQIILELIDNGQGFKDFEKMNSERPSSDATGMHIIKENLKQMGAHAVYAQNIQTGVTLSFVFSRLDETSSAL